MRTLKLVGALIAVLAFAVVATATASAAEVLWEWLPGETGTEFTGKSTKTVFQIKGGSSFLCQGSSILEKEGTITGERTLALAWIRFTGCAALGGSVNSLGDGLETILAHVEIHDCLIERGESEDLGLLIRLLPVHIEMLALGWLLSMQGAFIALATPVGTEVSTFSVLVTQKAGQQSIAKCEGSKAEDKLETSISGGEFIQTGLEMKEFSLTFAGGQTAME